MRAANAIPRAIGNPCPQPEQLDALAAAHGGHSGGGGIKDASSVAAALSEAEVAARFERQVAPSLRLAARIGPMHTAAT